MFHWRESRDFSRTGIDLLEGGSGITTSDTCRLVELNSMNDTYGATLSFSSVRGLLSRLSCFSSVPTGSTSSAKDPATIVGPPLSFALCLPDAFHPLSPSAPAFPAKNAQLSLTLTERRETEIGDGRAGNGRVSLLFRFELGENEELGEDDEGGGEENLAARLATEMEVGSPILGC